MKVTTPEISWHAKEAIYSIDLQAKQDDQPARLATAGIDSNVRIWELNSEAKTGVTFLSNLSRHEKAVNIVRFSKSGKILASGGDDCAVILWKRSEKEQAPNIFEEESDIGKNLETWNAYKILRGHLEDINDICWSADEKALVSGSIDHTAIVWDVVKGTKMSMLNEAKHFIHGVALDPLGQYVATLSCDRSLRIYSTQSKRILHNVCKMVYPSPKSPAGDVNEGAEAPEVKPQRIFHDENVVRRRLDFTCDGSFLLAPAGSLTRSEGDQTQQINTAYVFSRGCLTKPAAVLTGFKQPVTVVRCCPVRFCLRSTNENSASETTVSLPYRMVFAVASSDTVVLYDTEQMSPVALVGNIHYAAITDVTWSSDGRCLVVSSRDGFCTIVQFDEAELGTEYKDAAAERPAESEPAAVAEKQLCNGTNDKSPPKATAGKLLNSCDSSLKDSEKSKIIENGLNDDVICLDSNSSTAASTASSTSAYSYSASNSSEAGEKSSGEHGMKAENNGAGEPNGKDGATSKLPQKDNQENKPRRVQLITLSQGSPSAKSPEPKPRRVQLTTLSPVPGDKGNTPKRELSTPSSKAFSNTAEKASPLPNGPKPTTPRSGAASESKEKKRAPRRIQLTAVDAD